MGMIDATTPLPKLVADYLGGLFQTRWRPAFIQVGSDGCVISAGGALEVFGLSGLLPGMAVDEQVPLLAGMLPLAPQSEPFVLPWVNLDSGGYMDVHLLSGPGDGCDFVICLESMVDPQERVTMQQKGNETALQKHRQSQLLDRHVGHYVAEQLLDGALALRAEGERREASLLFCDIRGFTTFAEQQPPQLVFQTLNRFLQAMVQPILDCGGWLDKIAGDAVYTAFGLIPYKSADPHMVPAMQAVQAALQIVANVRVINDERRREGLEPLGVGIGITTGAVAVGILGTQDRRQFAVIGHHVNLAARLQGQALSGEIIVDGRTYSELGELARDFVPRSLRLKGLREDIIAHVLATER